MENKSAYGDRKTVGAIYRDAQIEHANDAPIICGDLTKDMMSSLCEDINSCIESKPNGEKPFFLIVHEKKDLLMKNAILRRIIPSAKRPYPEDDTMVFYIDPKQEICNFCWCLPHWAEMTEVMNNPQNYDSDYVADIKAWKAVDLRRFGFVKNNLGKWMPDPENIGKPMGKAKASISLPIPSAS